MVISSVLLRDDRGTEAKGCKEMKYFVDLAKDLIQRIVVPHFSSMQVTNFTTLNSLAVGLREKPPPANIYLTNGNNKRPHSSSSDEDEEEDEEEEEEFQEREFGDLQKINDLTAELRTVKKQLKKAEAEKETLTDEMTILRGKVFVYEARLQNSDQLNETNLQTIKDREEVIKAREKQIREQHDQINERDDQIQDYKKNLDTWVPFLQVAFTPKLRQCSMSRRIENSPDELHLQFKDTAMEARLVSAVMNAVTTDPSYEEDLLFGELVMSPSTQQLSNRRPNVANTYDSMLEQEQMKIAAKAGIVAGAPMPQQQDLGVQGEREHSRTPQLGLDPEVVNQHPVAGVVDPQEQEDNEFPQQDDEDDHVDDDQSPQDSSAIKLPVGDPLVVAGSSTDVVNDQQQSAETNNGGPGTANAEDAAKENSDKKEDGPNSDDSTINASPVGGSSPPADASSHNSQASSDDDSPPGTQQHSDRKRPAENQLCENGKKKSKVRRAADSPSSVAGSADSNTITLPPEPPNSVATLPRKKSVVDQVDEVKHKSPDRIVPIPVLFPNPASRRTSGRESDRPEFYHDQQGEQITSEEKAKKKNAVKKKKKDKVQRTQKGMAAVKKSTTVKKKKVKSADSRVDKELEFSEEESNSSS